MALAGSETGAGVDIGGITGSGTVSVVGTSTILVIIAGVVVAVASTTDMGVVVAVVVDVCVASIGGTKDWVTFAALFIIGAVGAVFWAGIELEPEIELEQSPAVFTICPLVMRTQ